MILPWLSGFLEFRKAPVTWLLFLFNMGFYVFLAFQSYSDDKQFDRFVSDTDFLKTQAFVFAQFIERRPAEYPTLLSDIAARAQQGHRVAQHQLSGLALRDARFAEEGPAEAYFGDEVAIADWKDKFESFVDLQKRHPSQVWGVSSGSEVFWKTVTYQFVHGGYFHLVTNMFFLLIFGGFLEVAIGGAAVFFLYLLGGVAAALAFSELTGLSLAPLIGASGAINGLIGFFAVFYLRHRMSFFYFLLPRLGYYGKIELPVWIFLILWVLSDFASVMASVPELGGVAYTAHLGGFAFGLGVGALVFLWRKAASHGVFGNASRLHKML